MNNSLAASVFIMRLKKLIERDRLIFKPRNRQKTMQFLFDEGLTVQNVMDYVRNLTPEDFYSGPTADDKGTSGDVMVFFKNYEIQNYISN